MSFADVNRRTRSRLIARQWCSALIAFACILSVRLTAERLSPVPSEAGQCGQAALYIVSLLDPQTLEHRISGIGVEAGLKLREQLSVAVLAKLGEDALQAFELAVRRQF